MAGALHVATDADKPKPLMNVSQATAAKDRRAQLIALERRIAAAIDDPKTLPRDLAALTRRLQDISEERESLGDDEQEARAAEAAREVPFDATAV